MCAFNLMPPITVQVSMDQLNGTMFTIYCGNDQPRWWVLYCEILNMQSFNTSFFNIRKPFFRPVYDLLVADII